MVDWHGSFIYGSQKFGERIKKPLGWRHTGPGHSATKKHHKRFWSSRIIKQGIKDIAMWSGTIKNSLRVRKSDKSNGDILLYLLWQEGKYTNVQIGALVRLTHFAVSRRVAITRKKMAVERNFHTRINAIKSQIKPWPHLDIATKALSNKLARICYYIMRDNVPFREELSSQSAGTATVILW